MSIGASKNPIIIEEVLGVPLSKENKEFEMGVFRVSQNNRIIECVAIYAGLPKDKTVKAIPVRIHSGCVTSEVFGSDRCDCAWQLHHALNLIEERKHGILIYIAADEGRNVGLTTKVRSFLLLDRGATIAESCQILGIPQDARDYRAATAVLKRLGVTDIELITNNPDKVACAEAAGLRVVCRIPTIMEPSSAHIRHYLEMKRDQFGHFI